VFSEHMVPVVLLTTFPHAVTICVNAVSAPGGVDRVTGSGDGGGASAAAPSASSD
jgi:hypothetical protein